MPVSYFTGAPLDIRPRIVPTPVDPLEQAIRQAQLYNLQQEPDIRRKQLGLQQLGLTEQQRHNKADEVATTRSQDVAIRGQDITAKDAAGNLAETTRYHDIIAKDSAAQQQTAFSTAILAHGLNAFDPEVRSAVGGTLAKLGHPELQQTLDAATAKTTKTAAANKLNELITLHAAGQNIKPIVSDFQTKNPDAYELIKDHLPDTVATPTPQPAPLPPQYSTRFPTLYNKGPKDNRKTPADYLRSLFQ